MNLWDIDFKKLQHPGFTILLLSLLLFITPGVLALFVFARPLFESLESIKLILLSISLVSPLVSINTLVWLIALDPTGKDVEYVNVYVTLLVSIITSGLLVYVAALCGYFDASLQNTILMVLILEFAVAALSFITGRSIWKEKQKSKTSGT